MSKAREDLSLDRALAIPSLISAFAAGLDPTALIRDLHGRIRDDRTQAVWIDVVPLEMALAQLDIAKRRRAAGESLPLYGIPFAVKDNIDVAGMPTTAGCPAFAYTPKRSAKVVEQLVAAGAILLGKTNLDQFATGLTGARSPYGTPSCVFDPRYIAGGSSSGSAVAVGRGLVSFALGTDTAGSGRVPAAFNNIVGLKPTRGWLSTSGVFPACRSLDCVGVFAATVEDALTVTGIAAGFDPADAFSRAAPGVAPTVPAAFRFGVPAESLEFFGDDEAAALFAASIARLEALGGVRIPFDFAPFREASELLYGGPWVAERLAALKGFVSNHADDFHPVTREIVLGARRLTAVDAFEGQYRLAALVRRAESEWAGMDVIVLPTTGTIYRLDDVLADPIRLNNNLGLYTNFTNLMDLSAVAVPAGFRPNGLPFGVTVMGRAFADQAVAAIAARLHRSLCDATIGATGLSIPDPPISSACWASDTIELAVVGAHLTGQALNHELTQRGSRLARTARTAAGYSLYALVDVVRPRPGLIFDGKGRGGIEVEVWTIPTSQLGSFIANIPPPLGIGTVALDDGSTVKGFLCESHALAGARDITVFGSWRSYLGTRG